MTGVLADGHAPPVGGQLVGRLLEVRGLSVSFGGVNALTELALEVDLHDLVAIIGPNGAGKTTTLNAISRLIPSEGEMILEGRSIATSQAHEVAALRIGRSFQDPQLIDGYSVLENVVCGAHLHLGYSMFDQLFRRGRLRAAEAVVDGRARELLEFAGLGDVMDQPAGELSYGTRKLVDIMRAIAGEPRLLLLDEPSSGLDAMERQALQDMLISLRDERSLGILVVEHHMDLVRATATKVVALQAGRVFMTGAADEVLDSASFRTAIVGGEVPEENGMDDGANQEGKS